MPVNNPYATVQAGNYRTDVTARELVEEHTGKPVRAGVWIPSGQQHWPGFRAWMGNCNLTVLQDTETHRWSWRIVDMVNNTDYRDGSEYVKPEHAQAMCKSFYRNIVRGDVYTKGR